MYAVVPIRISPAVVSVWIVSWIDALSAMRQAAARELSRSFHFVIRGRFSMTQGATVCEICEVGEYQNELGVHSSPYFRLISSSSTGESNLHSLRNRKV